MKTKKTKINFTEPRFEDLENLTYNGHKPVSMFPEIYNIKPCLNQSHPVYHPDSVAYERYWREQEKRCIEGLWFEDKKGDLGGWRYMTPHLYFYINFCIIEDEGELGGKITQINHPLLRDIEWMLSYAWLTARKFSGFEDDDEYTCHRIVEKIEKGEDLSPKEQMILSGDKLSIYKKDGTLKKYIEAREYLYKTHDKPLGLPLYENEALNLFVLGSRGWGKSFFSANGVIGHEYNFSGKTRLDEEDSPATIFVGAAIADKSAELLKKFEATQERLKTDYGSYGKNEDFIPGYFYLQSVGSTANNSNSPYRNEYEYKEGGTWVTGGTGTKIVHKIYTTENPQAAVGNRCSVIVVEEVGLLSNLLLAHGSNETVQIRKTKFGSSLYIGTGGNMEKVVESKIIFEDPEKYNFIPYKDQWEGRSQPIGFFLPSYYVDNSFKDENGNTDIHKAFAEEVYQRKLREKASNSLALDSYIMARPIIPSEMFLSINANVFPVAALRKREAEIEVKKLFDGIVSIGTLDWNKDHTDVTWREDTATNRLQKPIRHLNLDSYRGHLASSIVIYEHPVDVIPTPTYSKSLYKVTYDPVRDDVGGTSLASILVYKGYTDTNWNMGIQDGIVAEWIGRLDKVDDMHEICLKLAYYYNALILFENNLPGFKTYCTHKKHLNRLMIEPKKAVKKAVANPSGKNLYGVDMTPKGLHIHAEQLGRQWLLEEWKTLEDGTKKLNLDKLLSLRLIRELSSYEHDKKGNFDHVSSFKLLMLWLSDEREGIIYSEHDSKKKYDDINQFTKSLKQTYGPQHNKWFNY